MRITESSSSFFGAFSCDSGDPTVCEGRQWTKRPIWSLRTPPWSQSQAVVKPPATETPALLLTSLQWKGVSCCWPVVVGVEDGSGLLFLNQYCGSHFSPWRRFCFCSLTRRLALLLLPASWFLGRLRFLSWCPGWFRLPNWFPSWFWCY